MYLVTERVLGGVKETTKKRRCNFAVEQQNKPKTDKR